MAKKTFKSGLDSLIQPKDTTVTESVQEQSSPVKEAETSEETRATFIVEKELLEKLKDHAYWERFSLKEMINTILRTYFDGREVLPRKKV